MNEFTDISMFVTVAREGSFSAAARLTGLTPSAVSRQISALEQTLGARLFQRTTRRQSLTEAGVTYLEYAESVIATLSEAKLAVNRLTERVSGTLCISAETDMAHAYITPHLPEFFRLHPELEIRLNVSTDFVDLINDGIDVAIRIGHLKDSSLMAKKLGDSQSVICASPQYTRTFGAPNHPNELHNHNCLSFKTSHEKRVWTFRGENEQHPIEITGNYKVNNLSLIKAATLSHVGIAMLPTWIIKEELKSGELIQLLNHFSLDPPSTPINAIYSHKQHLAPNIRAFVDFLAVKIRS